MSQSIARIGPMSVAKILGVMYLVLGAIFAPLMLLVGLFGGESEAQPFGVAFALFMPLMYGLMGFIGGGLFCWLYNLVSKRVGGIEISFSTGDQEADVVT